MSENTKKVEQHGCLVCGKIYQVLVIYNPAGQLVDSTVTSPGGRRLPDETRPLVVCDSHSQSQVDLALERHYPGSSGEEDKDEN